MVQIVGYAVKNGEPSFFISQGKSIASARKGAGKKYHCKVSAFDVDMFPFLHRRFTKQWSNGNYWLPDFPTLCFPKSNHSGVVPIDADLYRRIEAAVLLGELEE